jgi:hypothetical protein
MMKQAVEQILHLHHIRTSRTFRENFFSVKVIGGSFQPILIKKWLPNDKKWQTHSANSTLFKLNDMVQLALQCFYYLDIPIGECILQRGIDGEIVVYDVKQGTTEEHSKKYKEQSKRYVANYKEAKTFGADVEGLLFHKKRNKYIIASSLLKENNELGFDNAIVVKNFQVKNHILELRPQPAYSGEALYHNLILEFKKLKAITEKYKLTIVGGANPLNNLFLGGHLHIGNHQLTHHNVRIIDYFFTIPMSIIEIANPAKRRRNYGRLGSVRKNDYNGFEYRSLASWITNIPEMKTVLKWFVCLQKNSHLFPQEKFSPTLLTAYYNDDKKILVNEVNQIKNKALACLERLEDKKLCETFFQQVIETGISNNKEMRGNML